MAGKALERWTGHFPSFCKIWGLDERASDKVSGNLGLHPFPEPQFLQQKLRLNQHSSAFPAQFAALRAVQHTVG